MGFGLEAIFWHIPKTSRKPLWEKTVVRKKLTNLFSRIDPTLRSFWSALFSTCCFISRTAVISHFLVLSLDSMPYAFREATLNIKLFFQVQLFVQLDRENAAFLRRPGRVPSDVVVRRLAASPWQRASAFPCPKAGGKFCCSISVLNS